MRSSGITRATLWTLLTISLVALPPDPVYTITTIAGSDWVGDGSGASSAVLSQAEGLAVDPQGNLYIADAGDHRVRKVSPSGAIQTVAGTGSAGFSGDGGLAAAAHLNSPYGVALA